MGGSVRLSPHRHSGPQHPPRTFVFPKFPFSSASLYQRAAAPAGASATTCAHVRGVSSSSPSTRRSCKVCSFTHTRKDASMAAVCVSPLPLGVHLRQGRTDKKAGRGVRALGQANTTCDHTTCTSGLPPNVGCRCVSVFWRPLLWFVAVGGQTRAVNNQKQCVCEVCTILTAVDVRGEDRRETPP